MPNPFAPPQTPSEIQAQNPNRANPEIIQQSGITEQQQNEIDKQNKLIQDYSSGRATLQQFVNFNLSQIQNQNQLTHSDTSFQAYAVYLQSHGQPIPNEISQQFPEHGVSYTLFGGSPSGPAPSNPNQFFTPNIYPIASSTSGQTIYAGQPTIFPATFAFNPRFSTPSNPVYQTLVPSQPIGIQNNQIDLTKQITLQSPFAQDTKSTQNLFQNTELISTPSKITSLEIPSSILNENLLYAQETQKTNPLLGGIELFGVNFGIGLIQGENFLVNPIKSFNGITGYGEKVFARTFRNRSFPIELENPLYKTVQEQFNALSFNTIEYTGQFLGQSIVLGFVEKAIPEGELLTKGTFTEKYTSGIAGSGKGVLEREFKGTISQPRFGAIGELVRQNFKPGSTDYAFLTKTTPFRNIEVINLGEQPSNELYGQLAKATAGTTNEYIFETRLLNPLDLKKIEANSLGVTVRENIKPQSEILEKQFQEGLSSRGQGTIFLNEKPVKEFASTNLQTTKSFSGNILSDQFYFPGGSSERQVIETRKGFVGSVYSEGKIGTGEPPVATQIVFPNESQLGNQLASEFEFKPGTFVEKNTGLFFNKKIGEVFNFNPNSEVILEIAKSTGLSPEIVSKDIADIRILTPPINEIIENSTYGYTSEGLSERGLIFVKPFESPFELRKTIAHESLHAFDFTLGKIDAIAENKLPYTSQPSEIRAHNLELTIKNNKVSLSEKLPLKISSIPDPLKNVKINLSEYEQSVRSVKVESGRDTGLEKILSRTTSVSKLPSGRKLRVIESGTSYGILGTKADILENYLGGETTKKIDVALEKAKQFSSIKSNTLNQIKEVPVQVIKKGVRTFTTQELKQLIQSNAAESNVTYTFGQTHNTANVISLIEDELTGNSTIHFAKPNTRTFNQTIPIQNNSQLNIQIPKTISIRLNQTIPITRPVTIPRNIPRQRNIQVPLTIPLTTPLTIPQTIPQTIPVTVPVTVPITTPITSPFTIPITFPLFQRTSTSPPSKQNPINIKFKQLIKGFRVQSKRHGKKFLLPGSYTQQDAFAVGTQFVRNTLAASLKLVPSNEYVEPKGINPANVNLYTSKSGFLVQKRGTRLGAPTEVKEIQQAKISKRQSRRIFGGMF